MSEGRIITVLIADDHELLRDGLAQFLDLCEGIKVIGTAANGAEAIVRCRELTLDVVIMDIVMPVLDGIAATRILRQSCPAVRVVVLTNSVGDSRKHEALEAGAVAYLRKGITVEEIADAIRTAVA